MRRNAPDSAVLSPDRTARHSSGALPGVDPLTPTIFHTGWWLEAATGGDYDEVEVRSGGRVIGRLPFTITRHIFGLRSCNAPDLCHGLGPAIDVGAGNLVTRNNNHFDVTQALIRLLPPCSSYSMPLHAGALDTFAFTVAEWTTRVQFTFVVHPRGEATLWQSLRDKTRNVIRRAAERYSVTTVTDAAEFARVYETNLTQRNMHNRYCRISAVCAAALEHGHGRILAVRNEHGGVLAAIFVAWDQRAMYYILTSRSPAADNGVVSLLLWHSIRLANAKSLVFDFDNVGTPGSRLFYAGFGGQVEPRYHVATASSVHQCGRWMRLTVDAARRRLQQKQRSGLQLSLAGP